MYTQWIEYLENEKGLWKLYFDSRKNGGIAPYYIERITYSDERQ